MDDWKSGWSDWWKGGWADRRTKQIRQTIHVTSSIQSVLQRKRDGCKQRLDLTLVWRVKAKQENTVIVAPCRWGLDRIALTKEIASMAPESALMRFS